MSKPSDIGGNQRQYFKRNYVDVLEILTPDVYVDEDISLSGLQLDPVADLINTHVQIANDISSILFISATTNISSITSISGICPYFVKQNNLTRITPFKFERDILCPISASMKDYETSADWKSYLSGTLMPMMVCNGPSAVWGDSTASGAHEHLTDTLSWFYFLNRNATFAPSSYVLSSLTRLFVGEELNLNDGIKGLEEFIWRNYVTCASINQIKSLPGDTLSGTSTYTSGLQQLDKLKTLVDVVYSPLNIDAGDVKVREAFEDYISTKATLTDVHSRGPFYKLLKAFSYSVQDINDQIETLNLLYDIERCPEKYLDYVANLIGWKFLSHDPERQRLQLRNAVNVYKAKGTKKAVQLAIDSIFTHGVFAVSGGIVELYESYIPKLLYYMLATESNLFDLNFKNINGKKAKDIGMFGYSNEDMDLNVRYAVDKILLDTVKAFPKNFAVGECPFDLEDPNFIFKYRDVVYQIPPWEEEKYYKDTWINFPIIDFLKNKLKTFGCATIAANKFGNYVSGNTLVFEDNLQLDNRWLFFTSAVQVPFNYTNILNNPEAKREDLLSMWSGKSSHFHANFETTSFTYNTKSSESDSSLALINALQCVDQFSPAHAIPLTVLALNDQADVLDLSGTFCPVWWVDNVDASVGFNVASSNLAGFKASGINLAPYGQVFNRYGASSFQAINTSSQVSAFPRKSIRRRNLKYTLPKEGLYLRDGFNMPTAYDPSTTETSISNRVGFLPLGFIPSAGMFKEIGNYNNLPPIYKTCENLTASTSYYKYDVSDTYPCRGLSSLNVSAQNLYVTRGNLNPIVKVMHEIIGDRILVQASTNYVNHYDSKNYAASDSWVNLPLSLANVSAAPNHYYEYENFQFGSGIHRLYNDYTDLLGKHGLAKNLLETKGGKDIFSHTYGPLVYNGKLSVNGSAVTTSSQFIASSIEKTLDINYGQGSGILATSDTAAVGQVGTIVANSPEDLFVGNYEFRNPHIISGVELIVPSGSTNENKFNVYKLHHTEVDKDNKFAANNTMVKLFSVNGLPRMRFDLSAYGDKGKDVNFFVPEHDFRLRVRAINLGEDKEPPQNLALGVWIHTKLESGKVWSYYPDGKWRQDEYSDVSGISYVKDTLAHKRVFKSKSPNPKLNEIVLSNFKAFTINFDTKNQPIAVPQSYYKFYRKVHRPNQRYFVEVFKYASLKDDYLLVDRVNIVDITQSLRVREYRRLNLWRTLRFFNDIEGDIASRRSFVTSGIFEVSGGSRVNYREEPGWVSYQQDPDTHNFTRIVTID